MRPTGIHKLVEPEVHNERVITNEMHEPEQYQLTESYLLTAGHGTAGRRFNIVMSLLWHTNKHAYMH